MHTTLKELDRYRNQLKLRAICITFALFSYKQGMLIGWRPLELYVLDLNSVLYILLLLYSLTNKLCLQVRNL